MAFAFTAESRSPSTGFPKPPGAALQGNCGTENESFVPSHLEVVCGENPSSWHPDEGSWRCMSTTGILVSCQINFEIASNRNARRRWMVKNGQANGGKLTMMFVIAEGVRPLLTGVRIEQVGDESPGTSQAPPKAEREILDDIKRLIENKSHADQFSGAILIARGPDVIWQNAYGMADENFGIANQVTTRFDTGSIAKSFTRVAIAQLLEQGKLHLEDTIGHFLPDYPNPIARDKVTVSELLDMRSGMADFFGAKFEKTPRGDIRVLADYLPLFATEPLAFDPGTQRAYSNGGYIVLGLILEKASGETYYDYVQNHIFAPAGMNHSD
jgi:CubicO group peptidase (beta-lactamase class C family)